MSEVKSDFSEFFRRDKTLAVIFLISVIASVAVSVVVVLQFIPSAESALGSFQSPRLVLNRTPNTDSPSAFQGEIVVVRGENCANRTTTTEHSTYFVRRDEPGSALADSNVPRRLLAGCSTMDLPISMPGRVVPGIWRIEGLVKDVDSGEGRVWFTEDFKVIAR